MRALAGQARCASYRKNRSSAEAGERPGRDSASRRARGSSVDDRFGTATSAASNAAASEAHKSAITPSRRIPRSSRPPFCFFCGVERALNSSCILRVTLQHGLVQPLTERGGRVAVVQRPGAPRAAPVSVTSGRHIVDHARGGAQCGMRGAPGGSWLRLHTRHGPTRLARPCRQPAVHGPLSQPVIACVAGAGARMMGRNGASRCPWS